MPRLPDPARLGAQGVGAAQKDIGLWQIKGDPLLKNLESDPRYKAFLRKMNLPE